MKYAIKVIWAVYIVICLTFICYVLSENIIIVPRAKQFVRQAKQLVVEQGIKFEKELENEQ